MPSDRARDVIGLDTNQIGFEESAEVTNNTDVATACARDSEICICTVCGNIESIITAQNITTKVKLTDQTYTHMLRETFATKPALCV